MRALLAYVLIMLGVILFAHSSLENLQSAHYRDRLLRQWEEISGEQVLDILPEAPLAGPEDIGDTEEAEGQPVVPAAPQPTLVTIGVLVIEKIDLRLPILDGTSEAQLRVGACLLEETARLDETGNTVLTAHRSHTRGLLFNRLDEVAAGDIIQVETESVLYRFVVQETHTIPKEDVTDFTGVREGSVLTLITCHPLGQVDPPYRLVVVAGLVQ